MFGMDDKKPVKQNQQGHSNVPHKDGEVRFKELEHVKKELEETKKQTDEFRHKYLRALADYQNLEHRAQQDKERVIQRAAEQIIHELLVVLDTFESVQKQYPHDQGVSLGVQSFQTVLASRGLKKIEVLRKKFDPVEMECTEVVESDKDGEVVEEVRPGYRLSDKIIRVARVKVGKKKQG